jgi:oxaloacetate decarboxylase alpha subunit
VRRIGVIDTTLRDAHQCLWATRMTTGMMLPVVERMDQIGFDQIDLAGTVQFDVCVRYLKENPWERVRLMRERVARTPLRALVRSRNIMSFDFVPDDAIELWVERLVANGFRVVGAFDGLNDIENMLPTLAPAKRLGVHTFGALSFSESPVHTNEMYVRTASELVERGKVDAIMLKDASGVLTVDRVRTLVPALKAAIGEVPLEVHSHCLTALAPLVYLEAARLGADQLHLSIAPLANGAAQPATQTVVRALRQASDVADIDDDLVAEVSDHFRAIAEAEGLPLGRPVEYDPFHYRHQVPGGMLSNLEYQLAEAGIPDQLDAVLEECGQIREELGWPIMITPFAQFVGTQAVLNVVGRGRYASVPDEVKKYVLGYYGKLPAPVNPDILDRIVENGSQRIPLEPQGREPVVDRLRRRYPHASDDERLLYLMFVGSQVDDMLAAGPITTEWAPPSAPLRELIRQLAARAPARSVRIQKGQLLVELGTADGGSVDSVSGP